MDIRDLTAALKSGDTMEDAATHLCRSETWKMPGARLRSLPNEVRSSKSHASAQSLATPKIDSPGPLDRRILN